MKLIVGLGNPGKKYEKNRHNIGHMFIDYMLQVTRNNPQETNRFILAKTDTFMNESGTAVRKIMINNQCSIINLIVVHDDLDIKLGEFKIQKGKGPRLHNGIESIEKALGTADFWRVRIGVDNRAQALRLRSGRTRPSGRVRIPGEKYVLMDFKENEIEKLNEVFENILSSLNNLTT